MIPYEELCEALARWRERNGLANGPSARMPQGPIVAAAPAFEPAHTDEMQAEQQTVVAPNPLAQADDPDAPTGLHVPAPVRVGDSTSEIEESMLVDEDA